MGMNERRKLPPQKRLKEGNLQTAEEKLNRWRTLGSFNHVGVSRDRKVLGKAVFLCLCHVSGQSNDLHAEKEATRLLQGDCGSWTIPRFEAQQIGVSSSDEEIRKEELVMSIILDMYVLNLLGDIPIQRGVLKG